MSDAELESVLPGYDAVIVRSANCVTRRMLEASPRVAVVGRAGSGVDNIDLEAAQELGVPVVNAPTGNAGSVAGQLLKVIHNLQCYAASCARRHMMVQILGRTFESSSSVLCPSKVLRGGEVTGLMFVLLSRGFVKQRYYTKASVDLHQESHLIVRGSSASGTIGAAQLLRVPPIVMLHLAIT